MLNFNNTATVANAATEIINSGTVNVNNSSNLGMSLVTNYGAVFYNDTATAANNNIHNLGTVDISAHTGNVTVGMFESDGGFLRLGANKLNVSSFSLDGNDELAFTLGTNSGQIISSGPVANGSTDTTVDLFAGNGFTAGTYHLITFGVGEGSNIDPADFQLGQSIDGFVATFSTDPNDLNVTLTAVPEVSSFIIPAFGAAGLFAFRRRMSKGAALPTVA